jgi:putative endonuclease
MFDWFVRIFRRAKSSTAARGEKGERIAASFLRRERGFAIIARNWRSPKDRRAEIDLVCRDGRALVFVEVKTRASSALVSGYFAVTRRKRRALRRACVAYLARLPRRQRAFRFDVVEVALDANGEGAEVHHFAAIPLFAPRQE